MQGHVVPRFVHVQRVVLRSPFLRPDRQKRKQGDRNEGHNPSAHRHLPIVLTLNEAASFCNRRKEPGITAVTAPPPRTSGQQPAAVRRSGTRKSSLRVLRGPTFYPITRLPKPRSPPLLPSGCNQARLFRDSRCPPKQNPATAFVASRFAPLAPDGQRCI